MLSLVDLRVVVILSIRIYLHLQYVNLLVDAIQLLAMLVADLVKFVNGCEYLALL